MRCGHTPTLSVLNPLSLLPVLPHATIHMKGAYIMDRNTGIDSGNWQYQFVEGILYITSKTQPGQQVALTANEASDFA